MVLRSNYIFDETAHWTACGKFQSVIGQQDLPRLGALSLGELVLTDRSAGSRHSSRASPLADCLYFFRAGL